MALLIALAGSAGASPVAVVKGLTKSDVRHIATAQIARAAPKLTVARADEADFADIATLADSATLAERAKRADTADAAETAKRADTATTADHATTADTGSGGGGPTGMAGGALSGTYPNPDLAEGAVTAGKLANAAVSTAKLADGAVIQTTLADAAVATTKLVQGAVSTDKLRDFAVTTFKLADGAVTAAKLAASTLVEGAGFDVGPGNVEPAYVSCPFGARLVAVGYRWANNVDGTAVLELGPTAAAPNRIGYVRGRVDSGGGRNVLYAVASCLG